MVKKRPVIIIKKHKHNGKLVYILPISNLTPGFTYTQHKSPTLSAIAYATADYAGLLCDSSCELSVVLRFLTY